MIGSLDRLSEVTGTNILKQLGVVVPDFFDRNHVVMQMQPKPTEYQITPHIKYLWPVVVESTHTKYTEGYWFDMVQTDEPIKNILDEGFNLLLSPDIARRNRIHYSDELLEERPVDSLVIATVDNSNSIFEGSNPFYSHNPLRSFSRAYGFNRDDFGESLCRGKIHFAFLPEAEYGDLDACFIDRDWELKH